jgi:hypothetical protein
VGGELNGQAMSGLYLRDARLRTVLPLRARD